MRGHRGAKEIDYIVMGKNNLPLLTKLNYVPTDDEATLRGPSQSSENDMPEVDPDISLNHEMFKDFAH